LRALILKEVERKRKSNGRGFWSHKKRWELKQKR